MDDHSRQPVADKLTQREQELLRLVADGLSNQDIADRLVLSLGTVKWYLKQIYSKLDVSSRTQAIAAVRAAGLLGGGVANVEPSATPHNLPHQPTSFIGRDKELTGIARRLQDPVCRLLTVVGSGGMGKTRLALQAAEPQIEVFADGVHLVSLAPLSAPESIVAAIAEAVRFSFYPGPEPRQQLLDYLRAKHLLLVLDNFEHLLSGAALVADILATAPKVKILATSRERLNLQGETLFLLDGMAYPSLDKAEDAAEYSAVKLFLQSAIQIQPEFSINAETLSAVSRICRQVQGTPLGILLAAAWVGMLSVQEIAEEIQKSLDFLETDQRDMPDRQRSLRAAFDHSWKLLTSEERDVFKRLSVFRGGFTREAAQEVAGASLRTLLTLVNKSLLRRDSATGRYEIHELLRQFGEQQLHTSFHDAEQTCDLHCAYYAGYMQRQRKELLSLRQGKVLDEMEVEFYNVLEAWNRAVDKRRTGILNRMVFSVWCYWDKRPSKSEQANLYGRAIAALQSPPTDAETEILLGYLLAMVGGTQDDLSQGEAIIESGIAILRKYDCPEQLVFALGLLALNAGWGLGEWARGERVAREAIHIAREKDVQWGLGMSLLQLSLCVWHQGDIAQARHIAQECFRECEAISDLWWMAGSAVILLGPIATELGQYSEAIRYFEQSLRWSKEVGGAWGVAISYSNLGKVALLTEDYGKAKSWLQQSLSYFQKTGQKSREFYEALYYLSSLYAAQGRKEDAVEILAVLHEQTVHRLMVDGRTFREVTTTSLTDLQTALAADTYEMAVVRGTTLDLDTVVTEFLAT